MLTTVPAAPLVGVNELITGTVVLPPPVDTVNVPLEKAQPALLPSATWPVPLASAGTVICTLPELALLIFASCAVPIHAPVMPPRPLP